MTASFVLVMLIAFFFPPSSIRNNDGSPWKQALGGYGQCMVLPLQGEEKVEERWKAKGHYASVLVKLLKAEEPCTTQFYQVKHSRPDQPALREKKGLKCKPIAYIFNF